MLLLFEPNDCSIFSSFSRNLALINSEYCDFVNEGFFDYVNEGFFKCCAVCNL